MSRRAELRRATCARKVDYATWDDAEGAALEIARKGVTKDANPPAPYPCPLGKHYHVGHKRFTT